MSFPSNRNVRYRSHRQSSRRSFLRGQLGIEALEGRSLLAVVGAGSASITLNEGLAVAIYEFDASFNASTTRAETLSLAAPGNAAFTESPLDPATGTVTLSDPIRPYGEVPLNDAGGTTPGASGASRTRQATTLNVENLSDVLGSWATSSNDFDTFTGNTTLGEQIAFTNMQRWDTGGFGALVYGDFALRNTGSKLVLTSNIDFLNAAFAEIGSPNITVSGNTLNIQGDLLIGGGLTLLDTTAIPGTDFGDITITATLVSAPVVTDANISISGATGTGGAFKTGDTITATWNNTATGDNNGGITGVTVDFSQFGGGAAVSATNSGNIWTATYTISAGSIDATGRNVSVTATNFLGSGTTADTSNATVDNVAPAVVSINRADANPTNASNVNYTVTFSEPVSGVGAADFALATSGVVGASITSLTPLSASGTVLPNTTANGTTYLTYNRAAWATIAPSAAYTNISGTPTGSSAPTADADGFRWMFPDRFEGSTWAAAAYPADYLTAPLPHFPLNQPAGGFTLPVNTYSVNSFAANHKITDYNSTTNPNGYIGLAGSLRVTSDYNQPGASVWWEHLAVRQDPADSIWKIEATSGTGIGSVFELRNVTAETVNGSLHLSGDYVFGNTDWFQFLQSGGNGVLNPNLVLGHIDIIPAANTTFTVTVNTGTGIGSIGLNLVDDDSITDAVGNQLGTSGLGNGNFSGHFYTIVNEAPVAVASSVTAVEDVVFTSFNTSSFGFTDSENDPLVSVTISTLNLNGGTLTLSGTPVALNQTITAAQIPSLTYLSVLNQNGAGVASFGFTVNDATSSGTAAAVMSINVTAVNDNPTATNDSAMVAEDSGATPINVLTNDNIAPDTGETLSITSVTQPANGSVIITGGGTGVTFQPAANFFGTILFNYTISDGNGGNATATVTVTVTPINDVPAFVLGANQAITEDAGPQTSTGWATGISAGPANEIGQTLMFVVSNDNSSLFSVQPSLNAAGDLTYTPALNAFGSANVTVNLSDSAGGSALPQDFTITVSPVNDLPTISNISNQTILPDTSTPALPFTIGDVDTSVAALNVTVASSNLTLVPIAGISIIGTGANRTITVTPTLGQTGSSTITLTVDDGTGGVANQSFAVNVSSLVGTLSAQLSGGNLIVDDIAGRNNVFQISVSGGNFIVTDTAEMFDVAAAGATGGVLSNGNHTLSIPLASITGGASIRGQDGDDSYVLGDLSGLSRINLLGGNGNDLFGSPTQKISPATTTTIVISGENSAAVPSGTTANSNTFAATGDVLNLDIGTFSATGELFDTVSGQSISLATIPAHLPLYFNEIEDINLCDLNQLTNTTIGDLYVRTATGASDSLVFYQGYTASADVLAKINGRLISNTPFRPTGSIIVYARDMNDSVEMNFTIGNRLRAEFYGEDGNDTLWGAALNDLLVGGIGSDMLISSDGNDTLWGDNIPTVWAERQTGNANLIFPSNDSLYGGNGADFLFGQSGNDTIYGEGGDDYSHGGDGNDTMADTLGNNTLRGEAGADNISGSSGNDIILGGADNDIITGFGGRDMMIGGTGLDNVQDTNDNAEDILIGDSSPLEADALAVVVANYASASGNDATLTGIFANWLSSGSFASRVSALQAASNFKATVQDGSRDVLRGNQLNQNYFQNRGGSTNDLVRTTAAGDVVDSE